ncbi:DUF177 domain-containing protein [Roseovarius sp. SCSIO 43702]|uniref:YceD family protein n=1 Tax=Roseovarius sp. SCSIO 43702 TaxID=2823043 RepID=UPI001C72F94D|nr:DUF177 domain-containing protein [Roseovarius sp. SCSIO 43702]QYX55427.1 DUF177 domain-containing protein [Roseovarius sp. SCSIO 43702]
MAESPITTARLGVAKLSQRAPNAFRLVPDAEGLAALAAGLDLLDCRKVVFEGTVTSEGRRDWRLDGHLGATVVQACVATLEPVTTRIETEVMRRFLADGVPVPEAEEAPMPEEVEAEPLSDTIALDAILTEALSLALPTYPRADTSRPVDLSAAPEGAQPLTDEDVKPFAGLAALRDKLGKDD